jgi:hypothetical protein
METAMPVLAMRPSTLPVVARVMMTGREAVVISGQGLATVDAMGASVLAILCATSVGQMLIVMPLELVCAMMGG